MAARNVTAADRMSTAGRFWSLAARATHSCNSKPELLKGEPTSQFMATAHACLYAQHCLDVEQRRSAGCPRLSEYGIDMTHIKDLNRT
jgi:hypothetical protein